MAYHDENEKYGREGASEEVSKPASRKEWTARKTLRLGELSERLRRVTHWYLTQAVLLPPAGGDKENEFRI